MKTKNECQLLDRFLVDELLAVLASDLDAHLAECPRCREATEAAADLDARVKKAFEEIRAPHRLLTSRRQAVEALPPRPFRGSRLFWSVAGACAVLAASVLVAFVLQSQIDTRDSKTAERSAQGPAPEAVQPRVHITSDKTILSVPDRANPNFTIVTVYPAVRITPEREFPDHQTIPETEKKNEEKR